MGKHRHEIDLEDLPWFAEGRARTGPRVAAVMGGLAFAMAASAFVRMLLSMASLPGISLTGVFLLAWIVGGTTIYRMLERRSGKHGALDDDRDEDHERQREYRDDDHEEHEDRERRREPARTRAGVAGLGELALLTIAGIALALAAGFVLTGRATADASGAALTAGLTLFGAGGLAALLWRWSRPSTAAEQSADHLVRAQLQRIRTKCRQLGREARASGGIHDDLCAHTPLLERRAAELAEVILRLRRAAREAGRQVASPAPLHASEVDATLQREYDAANATQARLDGLLADNLRHQRACLLQLERIEDVLDAARLEVAVPLPAPSSGPLERTIVADLEAELEASRQAIEEIERRERVEA